MLRSCQDQGKILSRSWQDLMDEILERSWHVLAKIFPRSWYIKILEVIKQDLPRSCKILQDLVRSYKILSRCSTWVMYDMYYLCMTYVWLMNDLCMTYEWLMNDLCMTSCLCHFIPVPILACGNEDSKIHIFVEKENQVHIKLLFELFLRQSL